MVEYKKYNPVHTAKDCEVSLIDYTGKGTAKPSIYAAALLCFTKETRLQMNAGRFGDILSKSEGALMEQLQSVAATIPSSWEFVDYTFFFGKVSRAFTHQLVRSRHASFAQQTMRTVDMTGFDYLTGPSILADEEALMIYQAEMEDIEIAYKEMIAKGAKPEDARGILPTNILTNIVMKINLRTFVEMYRKRTGARIQDEYVVVMEKAFNAIAEVHNWIKLFTDQKDNLSVIKQLEIDIAVLDIPPLRKDLMLKALHRLRENM